MENNSLSSHFATRFAAAPLQILVSTFNSQVGNRGFNSARSAHDAALIAEFVSRGIDISAISHGSSVIFAHHIRIEDNRVVLAD